MTKYKHFLSGLCVCFISAMYAQPPETHHSVFLLGNFADIEEGVTYLAHLRQLLQQDANGSFTLVLTGDLVDGKQKSTRYEQQVSALLALADLAESLPGKLLLLPGDRDWKSSRRGGEQYLGKLEKRVKDYLKDKNYRHTCWAIPDGCPGPEEIEVNEQLTILALNTQWWNHPFDKPRPTDGICQALTPENLKEALQDAVEDNADRNVLIVGHHPVYSLGNYGGHFSVGDQFKPFPVAGTIRTAFRQNVGTEKDLANPRLQAFTESMNNLLFFHSSLIYASGHERNQQILRRGNNVLVNSGAPVAARYAAHDHRTIFSEKAAGIMELRYFASGKVTARFQEYNAGNGFGRPQQWTLFESACEAKKEPDALLNTSFIPCKPAAQAAKPEFVIPEGNLIQKQAGEEYAAGAFKRFWLGNHYRTTWTAPVKTPYLDLATTHGGLRIFKKGGGRQTTSLKFKSADGTEHTFRSVNKDPSKALNYRLRPTIAAKILRDQTSTQNPYGALAIAPLLDKTGILHATPKLYVLPDDPALVPFQEQYGNLFGMLEISPGKPNMAGKHFADADDIVQSQQLFEDFYERQNVRLDEQEFLRARLFDILVGDWSKHEDNWKWAAYLKDGITTYRPIPRDRDHVFSRQDGVIPWLADRKFGIQNIENFGMKIQGLRSLTFQAQHLDRFLLAGVGKEEFERQAKFLQEKITPAVIEAAVRNMPPETYELSGKIIGEKLKRRIQDLPGYAGEYYRLLSKQVDVVGTNDDEFFSVVRYGDSSVEVQILESKSSSPGGGLPFKRRFFPAETKEIRLWGLGGKDVFRLSGTPTFRSERSDLKVGVPEGSDLKVGVPGKIKIRAFGGNGDDEFFDNSHSKTLLYDKGENTKYHLYGKAKVVRHWNRELYEYDRMRFAYGSYFPLVLLGYNNYSGLGLNAGVSFTVRKFAKDGWHSSHAFKGGITSRSNKSLSYAGRLHQAIRRWDLTLDAGFADPYLYNYFYGLGNDSEKNSDLGKRFYEAAVKQVHFEFGTVRDFWQKSSFSLKAGYEQDRSVRIDSTFLDLNEERVFGAHQKLSILPVTAALDFDFRDSKGLPYRGVRAMFSYQHGLILNGKNEDYGIASGTFEYYLSTPSKHPLTLALRLGGSHTQGNAPWYKLPSFGDSNGLRGWYQHRFTGKDAAYFNSELRYQLLSKYTALVPVKLGVKVFYDRGRVQHGYDGESKAWREGYGFGVYLVPLSEAFTVSLSLAFSAEESAYPVFSVGTPF